ncbi:MAG: MmgE/PrpD family protein [Promethearchaeota archaeon]
MEITKNLAEFVVSTNFDDLPIEVVKEAKLCFLDWLGVALAGAHDPELNSLFQVIELIGGKEQATILGKNVKSSILNATLMNGMSSHLYDYDDTSIEFLGHASVATIPCILALSEWMGIGGKDFLAAYIIGFEFGSRVAIGASANHTLKGWHPTSTIGHFSSTAAAAKLLGLTLNQMVYAFGIAGTQAAGIKAVFGTPCKPFHPGKAGFNGLLSALLAQRGFTSIDNILEGKNCFWEMYSTRSNPRAVLKDLGSKWSILNNNYKFHASCHYTHAGVEAVLAIKKDLKELTEHKIDKVEIYVSPMTLENATIMNPKTGLEGKFSVPYVIANTILRDDTGMGAFTDEKVNDPKIFKLREKIKVIPDNNLAGFASKVVIYIDGESYEKEANLFTMKLTYEKKKEELLKKFKSLVSLYIKKDKIEELITRIENMEQENNMANLINLLV